MKHIASKIASGAAALFGLAAPVLTLAQSYDYDEYDSISNADATALAAFGGIFLVLFLVLAVIGLATTIFWIWMLVDAIRRDNYENKAVWIILMIIFGFIVSVIYYFVVKRKNLGSMPGAMPAAATATASPAPMAAPQAQAESTEHSHEHEHGDDHSHDHNGDHAGHQH